MLINLSIKNYALIAYSSIAFSDQFSIITGETGAGKSILLDALGLVLGKRADLSVLRDKDGKCIIEAQFQIGNYTLQPFFETNDIDYEEQTIVRREILPSGKSRAFVNDSPVNLNVLQALGDKLLDIHSQHQTQELTNEVYQIEIIDAIAQTRPLISEYQYQLQAYKKAKKQLNTLENQQAALLKEQDYNTFLLEELISAELKSGEQEELESEFEKLNNVEFVNEHLEKAIAVLNDEQYGVLHLLREIKSSLLKVAPIASDYQELTDRLMSVEIELNDIKHEAELANERLIKDPYQLELINSKLQNIYNLQKKHQVQTVEALLDIQNELNAKVFQAEGISEEITALQHQISEAEISLRNLGKQIHESRLKIIPALTEEIKAIISPLGMPNAHFQFDLKLSDTFLSNGMDEIELLFSANKGMMLGSMKKTASGGEMSRIMLAIKAILANYLHLPTIIFDEIDTGVSGDVADKMGNIMKQMGHKMQVFAITHLPQVAAKGNQHYKVRKDNDMEQTVSEIKQLTKEERILEIAQMLSGKNITDSAINHAKELLAEVQ
ncbi:DNA repair protein RecN [Myroides ceti]|uniref:DNA repair protein RecN n=1 Tax=Paenimyroides ceti TaxID=395087 RepID=A0ABT8CPT3_9FLAO|nr:DNA repair protein RecN [Paenimyroides ceti]MDN3706503.1 DNA repair protein RecN [Paenimyroides ceti]